MVIVDWLLCLQAARHEFITLLSHLVRLFPECPKFSELVCLADYVDVEVDFFKNITHIQVRDAYC